MHPKFLIIVSIVAAQKRYIKVLVKINGKVLFVI